MYGITVQLALYGIWEGAVRSPFYWTVHFYGHEASGHDSLWTVMERITIIIDMIHITNITEVVRTQQHGDELQLLKCVCFNANPLHYYVPRGPRYVDRWR